MGYSKTRQGKESNGTVLTDLRNLHEDVELVCGRIRKVHQRLLRRTHPCCELGGIIAPPLYAFEKGSGSTDLFTLSYREAMGCDVT